MSGVAKSIIGFKYGRWTVLERAENDKSGVVMWLCECDCDEKTQRNVTGCSLKSGKSRSCGCYNLEATTKHGLSKSRIYKIYRGMNDRCYNPKAERYNNYGGRGIEICNEWLNKENGFEIFYKWAFDNGYQDKLSIDRIDVNGNYEPENCKWATDREQSNNRRNTLYVEIGGITKAASDWEKEYNLPPSTIKNRYSRGWDEKDLLNKVINIKQKMQSGIKGITWVEKNKKWVVRIRENKKLVIIGYYISLEEASNVLNTYSNKSESI